MCMRKVCYAALVVVALGSGCNSKPNQARDSVEEKTVEEATKVSTGVGVQTGFRDRLAVQPTATNPAVARVILARKLPPIPQMTAKTAASQAQSETTDANAASTDAELAEKVRPEDLPEEGDEILVPPQLLGALIPGANFENVTRQEPINIKSLLEQQGIVLTNYQQLIELGITNYTIARAPSIPSIPSIVPEKSAE